MKKLFALVLSVSMVLSMSVNAFARFANTGYIYSCLGEGDSEDNDSIDSLEECYIVYDYVKKWGYDANIYINPTLSKFDDGELNSPIIHFAGHGTNFTVNTGGTSGISYGNYSGYKNIDNVDFYETEVAVLSACKTAQMENTNIAKRICENGANFSIGWIDTTDSTQLKYFTEYFYKHLDTGYTIEDAILNTYIDLLSLFHDDANVFKYRTYGNASSPITKLSDYSTKSNNTTFSSERFFNDEFVQYKVEEDVYYKELSNDFSDLEKYFIGNISNNFNLEDYRITEINSIESSDVSVIVLRYKVGELESDFGYNVIIIDDKVFLITELGTDITAENNSVLSKTILSDETVCNMALKNYNIIYPVHDQSVLKIFDSETGRIKYSVETAFGDEESGFFVKTFEYLK